jgi:hypothetical protein
MLYMATHVGSKSLPTADIWQQGKLHPIYVRRHIVCDPKSTNMWHHIASNTWHCMASHCIQYMTLHPRHWLDGLRKHEIAVTTWDHVTNRIVSQDQNHTLQWGAAERYYITWYQQWHHSYHLTFQMSHNMKKKKYKIRYNII